MPGKKPRYLSYLIRLWQVRERRGWEWQGSLESPGSGKRRTFPDLDSLFAFLQKQTGFLEEKRLDNRTDLISDDDWENT